MKCSSAKLVNSDNESILLNNIKNYINGMKDGFIITHVIISPGHTQALIIYQEEV